MKRHVLLRLEWHALVRALVELQRVQAALPELEVDVDGLAERVNWLRDFARDVEQRVAVALQNEAE